MRVPEGIRYNPSQFERLIAITAKAGEGLITIDPALGYTVNDRDFKKNFQDLFSEDYREFARRYHLMERSPIYSGAEHKGDPKLPNITVLPNLQTKGNAILLGSTMGHYQDNRRTPIEEVYEFQGYGAMVIDRDGEETIELWIAQDGDKVLIPRGCSMTIYNLDLAPLVTLDYANPGFNKSFKDLIAEIGPIFCIWYDGKKVLFKLNARYINRADGAGVRLLEVPESLEVAVAIEIPDRLGGELHRKLTSDPSVGQAFSRLGVQLQRAKPKVWLEGVELKGSLCEEAQKPGGALRQYFFFEPQGESGATSPEGFFDDVLDPAVRQVLISVFRVKMTGEEPRPGPRRGVPLKILVEGAGDLIQRYLGPALKPYAEAGQIKVWFVYDSSAWRNDPKVAAKMHSILSYLLPWAAACLDKSDLQDKKLYEHIRKGGVDIVFIANPHRFHCKTAREWLGYAGTIFIEKPIDEQVQAVETLEQEMNKPENASTAVIAFDHYRAKVLALWHLMPVILGFLQLKVKEFKFYMLEPRTIVQEGRLDTLKEGLLLDLMPHALALVTLLGRLNSLPQDYTNKIKAAIDEEDYRAGMRNETFAYVLFPFETYDGQQVKAEAFVGKAIGRESDEKSTPKRMEIIGGKGGDRKVLVDFKEGEVRLEMPADAGKKRTAYLCPLHSPYQILMRSLVEGYYDDNRLGFSVASGKEVLQAIDRMRRSIKQAQLLQYKPGADFEELIQRLP
jgi:predicted dehydrogenase